MERPTDADNLFEDVYIYGKLNYGFENDEITVSKLNVTGISSFTSDVTFEGDITLDEITARNANVTGVATVGTGLYLNGKLFDGDGDFGTAGQLLSSDGTDLNWIDASTTSVANANNVGTNANSTNADQFITFVGASSGNNPIRVDTDLKYNPVTNTLTATNFAGSGANLTGIVGVPSGCIILWSGAADAIPTGFVLCNGSNSTPDLRGRFIVGYSDTDNDYDVNDTGGSKDNTLSVSQLPSHNHSFSGSASHNHTHTKATHPSGSGPEQNQSGGPEDRTNFGDTGTTSTATVTISGTTGNQGSGSAIENRPPYYALCYIMKT